MFRGKARRNPASTRNAYSYGLESGHVPKQLEAKTSVKLKVKVVGIEEYQEKLKQLVELVEEINNMAIDIQTSGKFEL